MAALIVILVVSGALLVGAAWGAFLPFPRRLEGFVVAIAGGALVVSLMLELVEPATRATATWHVALALLAGAAVFSVLDRAVSARWGEGNGGGMLVAVTLDGVPENLALGVALIEAPVAGVAALAGSILLSNLPEAAGGAAQMRATGAHRSRVFLLWGATAGLLVLAALAGYVGLEHASPTTIALMQAFAAGAVVASLATEVFPTAYREDSFLAGFATAIGVVLAVLLDQL